jgi:hypothetical protein
VGGLDFGIVRSPWGCVVRPCVYDVYTPRTRPMQVPFYYFPWIPMLSLLSNGFWGKVPIMRTPVTISVDLPRDLRAAISAEDTGRGSLSAIVRAALLLWTALGNEGKRSLLYMARDVVGGEVSLAEAQLVIRSRLGKRPDLSANSPRRIRAARSDRA